VFVYACVIVANASHRGLESPASSDDVTRYALPFLKCDVSGSVAVGVSVGGVWNSNGVH